MIRRTVLTAAVAVVAGLAVAAPAAAHIDPDPKEAQAGSTLTVGFTVEHGCDGSPTVQIDMRLPEGVTDASPVPVEGWDESIDDDVITFVGGPLPADEAGTFEIAMTLPPTPDVTIYFPFVQRCEEGEIRWIALPDDSGDEPDEPAPGLDLVGPVVTTTTPDTTAPEPTTAPTAPSVDTVPDTAAPTTEAAVDTTTVTATTDPDSADDDGGVNTGTIVFIVSVLAALAIAAIVVVSARRSRASASDTGGSTDTDVDR